MKLNTNTEFLYLKKKNYLNPLDRDASFSDFLLDNVLSNERFDYQALSGDNGGQLFKVCGDDLWTGTLADLSIVLALLKKKKKCDKKFVKIHAAPY